MLLVYCGTFYVADPADGIGTNLHLKPCRHFSFRHCLSLVLSNNTLVSACRLRVLRVIYISSLIHLTPSSEKSFPMGPSHPKWSFVGSREAHDLKYFEELNSSPSPYPRHVSESPPETTPPAAFPVTQDGGGMRRANSTPPPLTPTKLRSKLTPTAKDRGLITAASIARARFAAEVSANGDLPTPSHNLPDIQPSPHIQNANEHAEKLGCMEEQVPISHLPRLPSHPPSTNEHPSHHLPPPLHESIPLTHLIPPTPLPRPHQAPHVASSLPIGVQPYYDPKNLHVHPGEGPGEGPSEGPEDDINKGGRTTNANAKMIEEAFNVIESVFVDLSRRTDIDVATLVERWMKSNATVAFQRSNRWNQYGKYYRTNQQDELIHTLGPDITANSKDRKYQYYHLPVLIPNARTKEMMSTFACNATAPSSNDTRRTGGRYSMCMRKQNSMITRANPGLSVHERSRRSLGRSYSR
jgi:hypothetical protein